MANIVDILMDILMSHHAAGSWLWRSRAFNEATELQPRAAELLRDPSGGSRATRAPGAGTLAAVARSLGSLVMVSPQKWMIPSPKKTHGLNRFDKLPSGK